MEELRTNGAEGGKEEDASVAVHVPRISDSVSAIENQVVKESDNMTAHGSLAEVLETSHTTLSDHLLSHDSTGPGTDAVTTTSGGLNTLPDHPNGVGHPTAEHSEQRPDFQSEPVVFSEDDTFARTFDPSQIDEAESDDASEVNNIQAFAKLEFDDGEFYMTTYAVELGRDVRAAREAHTQDPAQQQDPPTSRRRKRSRSSGPSDRSRKRYREHRNYSGSVVSETGGIIGVDPPDENNGETTNSNFAKAKSTSSSSQYLSRKSSFSAPKRDYNRLTLELEDWLDQHADTDVIDAPSSNRDHMPSADKIPLIPIHPPANADGTAAGQQGISRKHVKIFFNFAEHVFQVIFWGRNGGFVDDQWYATGETVTLVSGSVIQLKGVCIRFTLPEVPEGETGAEEADFGEASDSVTGEQIGYDMADSDEFDDITYGDSRRGGTRVVESEEEEEDEDEPEEDLPRRRGKAKLKAEIELKPEVQKPKRKGPGRPPKNGIMSKREQAQQAREARENAKAKAEGKANPSHGRGKGKTAKALELEASHLQPNGKRKYTKRKKALELEDAQRIRESTEQDDSVPPEVASRPAKDKKPIKPPRSPSPVFNEAELTPEQLAKPQSSYVVLIHEALTNSKTGQMSLPQIYRAIERRYPFFKLRVQTQGWQSSVRHNLSQHPAFTKIERDGKGWMWGLVPSVSIEKEKKRRATPPPAPQQNYQYPTQQSRYPQHSQSYHYGKVPASSQGSLPYPYAVPPMPFPPQLGANGIPTPFVKPQADSTYRSPYDSNPDTAPSAPTATPQAAAKENGADAHYPTPTSQPPYQQQQPAPAVAPSPSPAQNGAQIHPVSLSNTQRYSEDVLARVNAFKTALIKSLDNLPDPGKLVSSVINHKLYGNPLEANAGSDEAAILKALENIILVGIGKDRDSAAAQTAQTSLKYPDGAEEGNTVAGKAADIARKIQDEKPVVNGK